MLSILLALKSLKMNNQVNGFQKFENVESKEPVFLKNYFESFSDRNWKKILSRKLF